MTVDGTAGDRTAPPGSDGRLRSVRDRTAGTVPLASLDSSVPRPVIVLAVLVGLAWLVHGFRAVGAGWIGGDLLYHQALVRELLLGTFPLQGPYAGLPTYYPPGFHALVAATMAVTGLEAVPSISLLTALWMPVLPIGTFLLARRVSGRAWVAVLAVAITLFAGGLDLRAGRLWVNSLFLSGQQAWPLYPRDLVFGLLPFGFLAFLNALDRPAARASFAWALVAGLLFGVAGLIQVQLLLAVPFVLLAAALVSARDRGRPAAATAALVVTAGVALAVVAPWLLDQLGSIARNGGVALDSSDSLEPARFGLWQYPRQFGLMLPLAILGAGVALLFLRRRDGPRPGGTAAGTWRGDRPGAVALVAWAAIPFTLGVLYSPEWPLEDALRPQRMWLLASQPVAILAAIGLVALAEEVVGARWARPRLVPAAIVAAVLIAAVPATVATARLLSATWTRPTYAHLDLAADRVPDLRALVGDGGGRSTMLTYEDWSSLAWYETGQSVVGLHPAGYAKLAFDPARFTDLGQAERRQLLLQAFNGDIDDLVGAASAAGAESVVIGRADDGRLGLFDAAAVPASRVSGALGGAAVPLEGNGWDGLLMEPRAELRFTNAMPAGRVRLDVRLADHPEIGDDWVLRAIARTAAGDVELATMQGGPEADGFTVLRGDVDWPGDATLVVVADERVLLQSVRGLVPVRPVPPGWRVAAETPEAIVLKPES